MGNCSSKESETSRNKILNVIPINDWDSVSYHDDKDSDMISLDRLFNSELVEEAEEDSVRSLGGNTSVTDGGHVEEEMASTSRENNVNKPSKKVTFVEEKDVLQELYSVETLMEKKRKSFGADMTLFYEVFKDVDKNKT